MNTFMAMSPNPRRLLLLAGSSLPMILALRASAGAVQGAKPVPTGAKVFTQKCAPCHGKNGAGGAGFPKPLVGTRSVAELGKFIAQSMPPGKKTPPPEAQRIAAYMHQAFYSPIAQERNRPARVELARLTTRQFKNAVADLVGYSSPVLPPDSEHGLKALYYKSRETWDAKNLVLERTDPQVRFDFGTDGPVAGKFDPHNFSVVWTGSVLAPDTGDYEIIIRSDHATKLFLNGSNKPLIDAWVRSGPETEFRASVPLLGGRAYPLRMEFTKATQGVNDDEKKKGKPAPKAFVELLWRRPKRVAEPIPANLLFRKEAARVFVVSNPFPADDRSIGYERGNTVNKAWDDAVTTAALEAADHMAKTLPEDKTKHRDHAKWFVTRAFRRDLDKETERLYIDKQFETAVSPEMAMKRVVLLTLKSPRFLYREIGPQDPYSIAANLSFGLWDTIPDPTLQKAVWEGKLKTRAGVEEQAVRMANDPRSWNKLREFLLLWLKVDEIPDIVKSQKRFPNFDAAVAADLRTSLELFLESTAWSKESDFRQLMLSPTQFYNGRLSKLYGGGLPANAPFQPVRATDRAGVLTHPYLMSRYAYLEGSSPIHRGVLVARNMLGRVLAPPPAAFTPLASSLHPNLTTRERVALQTKPAMCNSCHSLINPIGFTFEKYDAIGRLRTAENGKPVDATGGYKARNGNLIKFKDASDLSRYLAASEETHAAFVEKLFQHLVKQPVRAYGTGTLPDLQRSFTKDRYSIRSLMVSIMVATAPKDTIASAK